MYSLDGRRFEADEHGLERALTAGHEARIRPLCRCSEPPVPVYIARLGETFVLKRMPLTGGRHAIGCTHYDPPLHLSGPSDVSDSAVSEEPDTGATRLRVGFAMSKGAPRAVGSGDDSSRGSVRSDGTRLSLRGLLHFLWDAAELTRWHPGFSGKRTWAVVRSHLLAAAANKIVRGVPLPGVLYVPEPFTVANHHEIAARRMRRFADGLQRRGDTRPLMLLIGEVKEIRPTRHHFEILVKHMPDRAFRLDGRLHRRMVNRFERELSLWDDSDTVRMLLIATFSMGDTGTPSIEELSLVPAAAQWILVDDVFDLRLVERLIREGRAFKKTPTRDDASALIADAADGSVASRVVRPDEERRPQGSGAQVVPTRGEAIAR
jgi:hypothetical protein